MLRLCGTKVTEPELARAGSRGPRAFHALLAIGLAVVFLPGGVSLSAAVLDPNLIPKYARPLVIPPVMPPTRVNMFTSSGPVDYYEIAARQFKQEILPPPFQQSTVYGYGSITYPGTFNFPAYTVEAIVNKPVRVKWINDLVDSSGNYLPPFLPIDQTLHWANPPGGIMGRDMHGTDPNPYTGPVPIVTHLHGAHVGPESDGYPEAW